MNIKRTKLITSLGPVTETEANIEKLILNGADIARLNFSHGNGKEHFKKVQNVRAVSKKLGKPMSLLLDTKGPEIRTHLFEGGEATIESGTIVEIYLQKEIKGNANKFSISYSNLYNDVVIGGKILIDDGYLELNIVEIMKEKIITKAENTHKVSDRRGVNVPGGIISIDFLSDKDVTDIEFGCDNDFDYIALSFVQTAKDVQKVREILKRKGKEHIQLISKLESQGAVDNFREILEASDAIMVARGDLGVEIDPTQVPALQKKWVREANKIGKPVIVATQMLESMINNPRPTRAEVSDVYNAIEDATSAIMLSGESAKGKYFMESTKYMTAISFSSENHFNGQRYFNRINRDGAVTEFDEVAKKSFQLTFASNINHIFLLNPCKDLISIISRIKPYAKIVPVFIDEQQLTRWNLYYGVYPAISKQKLSIDSDNIKTFVKDYGLKSGEKILLIENKKLKELVI